MRALEQNVIKLPRLVSNYDHRALTLQNLSDWRYLILALLFIILALSYAQTSHLHDSIANSFSVHLMMALGFAALGTQAWSIHARSQRYGRVASQLHLVAHRLRDRVMISLTSMSTIQTIPASASSSLIQDALDDIAELFEQLSTRGTITVSLLAPISEQPQLPPSHLRRVSWSNLMQRMSDRRSKVSPDTLLPIYDSLAGETYRTGYSILVRDTRRSEEFFVGEGTQRQLVYELIRSLICVPVTTRSTISRSEGNSAIDLVLTIDCSEPHQFRLEHIDLARMAADLVAILVKFASISTATQ